MGIGLSGDDSRVLLSVDDIADSMIPTAELTPAEARRVAAFLISRATAAEQLAAERRSG